MARGLLFIKSRQRDRQGKAATMTITPQNFTSAPIDQTAINDNATPRSQALTRLDAATERMNAALQDQRQAVTDYRAETLRLGAAIAQLDQSLQSYETALDRINTTPLRRHALRLADLMDRH